MSDQTKDVPTAPINAKAYQQMVAKSPSFAQSMINVTTHLGTKPVSKPITGVRQFTDSKGELFQEMGNKTSKNGKTIISE